MESYQRVPGMVWADGGRATAAPKQSSICLPTLSRRVIDVGALGRPRRLLVAASTGEPYRLRPDSPREGSTWQRMQPRP